MRKSDLAEAIVTDDLLRRIYGEFEEMPGMQLTRKQAERLWGLDEDTCALVLKLLVDARFLWRTDHDDRYRRTTEGPITYPSLRMAKASRPAPKTVRVSAG